MPAPLPVEAPAPHPPTVCQLASASLPMAENEPNAGASCTSFTAVPSASARAAAARAARERSAAGKPTAARAIKPAAAAANHFPHVSNALSTDRGAPLHPPQRGRSNESISVLLGALPQGQGGRGPE